MFAGAARQQHHFFDHSTNSIAGLITEDLGRCGQPVPLPGAAGSVIFMHCVLPHSSLPNRSSRIPAHDNIRIPRREFIPIYCGEYVVQSEAKTRHLRGRPATFARFGGPPALIPQTKTMTSLYEMQRAAKPRLRLDEEVDPGEQRE